MTDPIRSTTTEPASLKTTKNCGSCGSEIHFNASVCKACRCFQGGWWWARLLGLSLPWFIAVVGVSTYAYQAYLDRSRNPTDDLTISLTKVGHGNVDVAFINSNTKPVLVAGLQYVQCADVKTPVPFQDGNGAFLIRQGDNNIVAPNGALVISYRLKELFGTLSDYLSKHESEGCRLKITFESNGHELVKTQELDRLKVLALRFGGSSVAR